MPSFCIREWSVVRLSPRSAAAPLGPPMTQLREFSARRIASRTMSSSVDVWSELGSAGDFGAGDSTSPACGYRGFGSSNAGPLGSQLGSTVNVSDSQKTTERSMTFCSSRTLPGHA